MESLSWTLSFAWGVVNFDVRCEEGRDTNCER